MSLRWVFSSRPTAEESPVLQEAGMSARQEGSMAKGEDSRRSGLPGQSEAMLAGLVQVSSRLLERIPSAASRSGEAQSGSPEGSERKMPQPGAGRSDGDEGVHDCKNGRVEMLRNVRRSNLLRGVLAGAGDCKNGRVKSKYLWGTGRLRMIAKEDSMERCFLPV